MALRLMARWCGVMVAAIYSGAVDALKALHRLPPGPFLDYGLQEYQREAQLFIDWFVPARSLYVDGRGWTAAWQEALAPLLPRQRPGVTVLRDYHAENIMLLGSLDKQGLLDFQDALVGHPAYDLVSLLQDARRDGASLHADQAWARTSSRSGTSASAHRSGKSGSTAPKRYWNKGLLKLPL